MNGNQFRYETDFLSVMFCGGRESEREIGEKPEHDKFYFNKGRNRNLMGINYSNCDIICNESPSIFHFNIRMQHERSIFHRTEI